MRKTLLTFSDLSQIFWPWSSRFYQLGIYRLGILWLFAMIIGYLSFVKKKKVLVKFTIEDLSFQTKACSRQVIECAHTL